MQFIVTDRRTLEKGLVIKVPYVVVSIRNPHTRKPRIRQGAGLRGVCCLAFDDAEPPHAKELQSNVKLMMPEDAAAIWTFFTQHRAEIGAVVCQCEEGMSRGPAIAAALAAALGEDPDEILAEADANQHVYALMLAAIDADAALSSSVELGAAKDDDREKPCEETS